PRLRPARRGARPRLTPGLVGIEPARRRCLGRRAPGGRRRPLPDGRRGAGPGGSPGAGRQAGAPLTRGQARARPGPGPPARNRYFTVSGMFWILPAAMSVWTFLTFATRSAGTFGLILPSPAAPEATSKTWS